MINTAVHVIARGVCVKEGKILLCENKKRGFFYLPGGHVEHQESAEQALVRELQEEIGVQVSVQKLLGIFEYVFVPDNPHKCHNHEYNFIFQVNASDLSVGHSLPSLEEDIAFQWISLDELNNVLFKPQMLKEPLLDWLKGRSDVSMVSVIE